MDLTPTTLREVEFREKLRGYHPDDVDDFLEEVAVALEGLLARLTAAESGLPLAAPPAATPVAEPEPPVEPVYEPIFEPDVEPVAARHEPPPPPSPAVERYEAPATGDAVTDDTLRRTLVLAQRTAELAVAEAEDAARELLEHAHAEANRVRDEAHARAATILGDAETRKAGLEREIAALTGWAVQHRDRLREALSEQVRSLDVWLAASTPPAAVRVSRRLSASMPRALGSRRDAAPDERGTDDPSPAAHDTGAATSSTDRPSSPFGATVETAAVSSPPPRAESGFGSPDSDELDAGSPPDPAGSQNPDNSDEPQPLAPRVFRRR